MKIFTLAALTTTLLTPAFTALAQPATPDICLVTVDDNSTHNIIMWDKTAAVNVDYYVLYRIDATGAYVSIDSIPYDSLSEYHDHTYDPNVAKVRYKLAAVDNMGLASGQSPYHEVMFCNEPTAGTFEWNFYLIEGIGNPATDFVMMRRDASTAPWVAMDTVSSTTMSFFDADFASFPDGEWRVRTIWGIECTATRAGISTSRSNVRTRNMFIGVNETEAPQIDITLYPNPASQYVTLQLENSTAPRHTITLRDASGRILLHNTITGNTTQLQMGSLVKGIYFIEVANNEGRTVKRLVKH